MPAFEVAHSAADLEPKLVQMSQGHDGRRRVENGQRDGHKSAFLVQVQFGSAGDKSEHFSNLLKTVAEEKVRVSAITFGAENEEIRFRVAQRLRSLRRNLQTVDASLFKQRS